MSKKIIIIGGGISGLTAGIYARKYGYETLILEKNPNAGGLCTGWNRKGWYLDGCVHWLTGTNPNSNYYKEWTNIGAFTNQSDLAYLPSWGSFEYDNVTVTFWADLEKAEKEWKLISPVDKKHIHRFFKLVKLIASFELPNDSPTALLTYKQYIKFGFDMIRCFPSLLISMKTSCEKYAMKFKSLAIRNALINAQPGEGNLYCMAFCYSTIAGHNGGIPIGGSKKMSESILNRYLSLGGKIQYNSPVKSINTLNNKVSSIVLEDETRIEGDYYVTCLDNNYVTKHLLNNRFAIKEIEKRNVNYVKNPSPSCCLLYFEVMGLEKVDIPFTFQISPLRVGTRTISNLTIRDYSYDPTYVKEDKSIVQVLLDQYGLDYDYWKKLSIDEYKNEKQRIIEEVLERIITRFPYLKTNIEVVDMVTPLTFERYCNVTRGAYMGYLFTPKKMVISAAKKAKGLSNLYYSGQTTETPGGLPMAESSGKHAIQWIVYNDSKKFVRFFKRKPYHRY